MCVWETKDEIRRIKVLGLENAYLSAPIEPFLDWILYSIIRKGHKTNRKEANEDYSFLIWIPEKTWRSDKIVRILNGPSYHLKMAIVNLNLQHLIKKTDKLFQKE